MNSHIKCNKNWQWIAIFTLLCLFTLPIRAAVPDNIDYQGYLTDSGGSPVNGTVNVTFALYNVDTGGIALWSDTQSVNASNGLFTVKLGGTGAPFPVGLFDDPLWLGINVESDGEMTPRIEMSSAGFAHKADDALTLEGQTAASLDQSAHVTDTSNPHSVTAAQVGAMSSADFTLHTSDVSAHHVRYTDAEAVSAMGPQENTNPLNHLRRSGDQVFNAVLSRDGTGTGLDADFLDGLDSTAFMPSATDNWVNTSGDTMSGNLNVLANIGIGTATPAYSLDVRGGVGSYLAYFYNDNNTTGSAQGIYARGDAYDTGTSSGHGGFFTGVGGSTSGDAYGSRHFAYAYGSSTAYGVLSNARGGSTTGREWAFYGLGDSHFSGQVGIGTDTPVTNLDVAGNSFFSGHVGIGTSSPTYKLEVRGGVADYLAYFYKDNDLFGNAYGIVSLSDARDILSGTGEGRGGTFWAWGSNNGGNAFGTINYAYAYGSSTAYGVFSNATGGTTTGREYAFYGLGDGYFDGDLEITGDITINGSPPLIPVTPGIRIYVGIPACNTNDQLTTRSTCRTQLCTFSPPILYYDCSSNCGLSTGVDCPNILLGRLIMDN